MALRFPMVILLSLLTSGCMTTSKPVKSVMHNSDISKNVLQDDISNAGPDVLSNLNIQPKLGFTNPYVPVIEPSVVKKVWVPAHQYEKDPDVLVAGHWVYVKVRGESWFIEEEDTSDSSFPVIIPTVPVTVER